MKIRILILFLSCMGFLKSHSQDTTRLNLDEVNISMTSDTTIFFTKRDKSSFPKGNYIAKSNTSHFVFSINNSGNLDKQVLLYEENDTLSAIWTVENGVFREKKFYTHGTELTKDEIYPATNKEIIIYEYKNNILYIKKIIDRRIARSLAIYDFESIAPDNYFSLIIYYPNGKIKQTSILKNKVITTKDFSSKGTLVKTTKQYAKPGLPPVGAPVKNKNNDDEIIEVKIGAPKQ